MRLTMTKKNSEDHSSSKAGKDKPGDERGKEENDESYHASSRVESDALRAMIGKRGEENDGEKIDDRDEKDNLSEK